MTQARLKEWADQIGKAKRSDVEALLLKCLTEFSQGIIAFAVQGKQ